MRRNYISPEYTNTPTFGTLNMLEESTFFGAKMLEIEDSILVGNNSIVWYQNKNGEQIDLQSESTGQPEIYSMSDSKLTNHTISLDPSQTQYTKDNVTKWIIDINIKKILTSYIFSELKNYRTFEGVRTHMTAYNDINLAIMKYVEFNVTNRYKFSKIDFYVRYIDLSGKNVLRFQNTWEPTIAIPEYTTTKFQTITDYTQTNLRVLFSQEKPSTQYKMDYYFNLFFEKI